MTTQSRSDYLATIPAAERSEAAARYDHQIEARHLSTEPITENELMESRVRLHQSRLAIAIAENAATIPYDPADLISRIHMSRIMSAGQERCIAELAHDMSSLTDEEIAVYARQRRQERLTYIRRRYGVS